MDKFNNHVGFSISDSKLQVVEVVCTNDHFFLNNVEEVFFEEKIDFKKEKETKINDILQRAFNELIIKAPIESKISSFSLPQENFLTAQLPFDNTLLHQDLIEEFRWEFSLLYPNHSAEEYVFQYLEIEKASYQKNPSAYVVGLNRKYLKILKTFCNNNNLELKYTDNFAFSSERALEVFTSNKIIGLSISAYYHKNLLSLIFSNNGRPILLKFVPINNVNDIPIKINDEITKNRIASSPTEFDSAFIAGDNLQPSLISNIKELCGIDFLAYNPFEKITAEPSLYKKSNYLDNFNSFTAAAGMAFRAV